MSIDATALLLGCPYSAETKVFLDRVSSDFDAFTRYCGWTRGEQAGAGPANGFQIELDPLLSCTDGFLTKQSALARIREFIAKSDSVLKLVIFGGHGRDNIGDWMLADGDCSFEDVMLAVLKGTEAIENDQTRTLRRDVELQVRTGEDKDLEILIISDCCFSGNWVKKFHQLRKMQQILAEDDWHTWLDATFVKKHDLAVIPKDPTTFGSMRGMKPTLEDQAGMVKLLAEEIRRGNSNKDTDADRPDEHEADSEGEKANKRSPGTSSHTVAESTRFTKRGKASGQGKKTVGFAEKMGLQTDGEKMGRHFLFYGGVYREGTHRMDVPSDTSSEKSYNESPLKSLLEYAKQTSILDSLPRARAPQPKTSTRPAHNFELPSSSPPMMIQEKTPVKRVETTSGETAGKTSSSYPRKITKTHLKERSSAIEKTPIKTETPTKTPYKIKGSDRPEKKQIANSPEKDYQRRASLTKTPRNDAQERADNLASGGGNSLQGREDFINDRIIVDALLTKVDSYFKRDAELQKAFQSKKLLDMVAGGGSVNFDPVNYRALLNYNEDNFNPCYQEEALAKRFDPDDQMTIEKKLLEIQTRFRKHIIPNKIRIGIQSSCSDKQNAFDGIFLSTWVLLHKREMELEYALKHFTYLQKQPLYFLVSGINCRSLGLDSSGTDVYGMKGALPLPAAEGAAGMSARGEGDAGDAIKPGQEDPNTPSTTPAPALAARKTIDSTNYTADLVVSQTLASTVQLFGKDVQLYEAPFKRLDELVSPDAAPEPPWLSGDSQKIVDELDALPPGMDEEVLIKMKLLKEVEDMTIAATLYQHPEGIIRDQYGNKVSTIALEEKKFAYIRDFETNEILSENPRMLDEIDKERIRRQMYAIERIAAARRERLDIIQAASQVLERSTEVTLFEKVFGWAVPTDDNEESGMNAIAGALINGARDALNLAPDADIEDSSDNNVDQGDKQVKLRNMGGTEHDLKLARDEARDALYRQQLQKNRRNLQLPLDNLRLSHASAEEIIETINNVQEASAVMLMAHGIRNVLKDVIKYEKTEEEEELDEEVRADLEGSRRLGYFLSADNPTTWRLIQFLYFDPQIQDVGDIQDVCDVFNTIMNQGSRVSLVGLNTLYLMIAKMPQLSLLALLQCEPHTLTALFVRNSRKKDTDSKMLATMQILCQLYTVFGHREEFFIIVERITPKINALIENITSSYTSDPKLQLYCLWNLVRTTDAAVYILTRTHFISKIAKRAMQNLRDQYLRIWTVKVLWLILSNLDNVQNGVTMITDEMPLLREILLRESKNGWNCDDEDWNFLFKLRDLVGVPGMR